MHDEVRSSSYKSKAAAQRVCLTEVATKARLGQLHYDFIGRTLESQAPCNENMVAVSVLEIYCRCCHRAGNVSAIRRILLFDTAKMSSVPWGTQINFASALLLHSYITILLKESLNSLTLLQRLAVRWWQSLVHRGDETRPQFDTSVVLDAYTSIFSLDYDGDQAELYFTNTGLVLLAISLAASVIMNLSLESLPLNMMVAGTFGLTFIASLIIGQKRITLPITALRRAGRFIWSDTPFVNFFSLIYIATVLQGQSTLRLQDYITFRSIAIFELIFMKAKLAASDCDKQIKLMKQLIESEWIVVESVSLRGCTLNSTPWMLRTKENDVRQGHDKRLLPRRSVRPKCHDVVAFTTLQRLVVMLIKTAVTYHHGCLQGPLGPANCQLPDVGYYIDEFAHGWKLFRLTEDAMVLADYAAGTNPKGLLQRFLAHAHGVLLRRLGKVRTSAMEDIEYDSLWHSNINLVTGVTKKWLDEEFNLQDSRPKCMIAGS